MNKNIKIEINKDVAQGEYSNLVLTAHSASEFVLDFAKLLPGVAEARVHTRVIMTPFHAKMLLKSIKDSIEKFEAEFGEIKTDEKLNKNIGFTNNQQ